MKQQHITDEVKRLAREIAKHWRMEIYEGCWITDSKNVKHLVSWETLTNIDLANDSVIPIPSISDCLERLRELGWFLSEVSTRQEFGKKNQLSIVYVVDLTSLDCTRYEDEFSNGNTLHEALLSALLEVLKGEKEKEA